MEIDNIDVMRECIIKILNDCNETPDDIITVINPSDNLKDDLALKSLNIVEILSEFDERLGTDTKLDEFINVKTVKDLLDIAEKKEID